MGARPAEVDRGRPGAHMYRALGISRGNALARPSAWRLFWMLRRGWLDRIVAVEGRRLQEIAYFIGNDER